MDSCPRCHSGRAHDEDFPCRGEPFQAITDILSWNSHGFIKRADMRRTYEGGDGMGIETYHVSLTINRRKK